MKSPWDKDGKTVVIKNDEVTELFDTNEENVDDVIEDTISKITDAPAEEFSGSLEASEFTKPSGPTIGEILISTSRLTKEHLEEALASQSKSDPPEKIGEILVKKKWITEDELLHALSIQLNIPIAKDLNKQEIDPDLVEQIPINFAKKYSVVPVDREEDTVRVAISNALDLSPIDDLRILLGMDVSPMLGKKSEILETINRVYDRATRSQEDLMEDLEGRGLDQMDMPETQDLLDSEDEAPIIRLVNTLLFRAVKERASDIHIEPHEKELEVRFRIDGILYEIMKPPIRAQASISSRIKIMAELDIAEKRVPQDGRIKIKIAGRDVDIRVSTLPTSFGERIVMRLLDTSNVILDLKDVGFGEKQLTVIDKIIHKSHGIFLVTGPTGSGKTTTLYSCLSRLNSRERNIITVEDPVEIQLTGIGQIQVNPKVNLTFASGLKSILRQDPDVIMVGEIRDAETAEIAIQASLTGHFVFSTLHTNDAASSITRLVDMGVEPFLVSSSLVAVMAQRLVRAVCPDCRQPSKPTKKELDELSITPELASKHTIYRPQGCPECWNTGYRGRTGIYEILPIDDKLRGLISKNADGSMLKKAAIQRGMKTLREDGALKVLNGITTIEEVMRVTQEEMTIE